MFNIKLPSTEFKHRSINFVYTNLDSIGNKTGELSDIISTQKPNIICLTATKTSAEDASNHIYECRLYEIFRKDMLILKPLGVGIYILVNKKLIASDFNVSMFLCLTIIILRIRCGVKLNARASPLQ